MKKTTQKGIEEYWLRPMYKGYKMSDIVLRPNALGILGMPSRVCNTLFYPDGRVQRSEVQK